MEIIAGWFILSVLAGVWASSKGRSGIGFFLLSILLSPLFGLLAAIVVKRCENHAGQRRCSFCAEFVQEMALACRYCGRELPGTGKARQGEVITINEKKFIGAGDKGGQVRCAACGKIAPREWLFWDMDTKRAYHRDCLFRSMARPTP